MNPQSKVYYEWARLTAMDSWWQYCTVAIIVLAILAYVSWLYQRDGIELPRGLRWSLLLLRIAAFTGLLLFFLNLQKRSEQPIARASRLAILVDSSLSMTLDAGEPLGDSLASDSSAVSIDAGYPDESRIEQVIRNFKNSELIDDFAAEHETSVYRFDASERPVLLASFKKKNEVTSATEGNATDSKWNWRLISMAIWTGTILLIISVVTLLITIYLRLRAAFAVQSTNADRSRRRPSLLGLGNELAPGILGYVTLGSVVATIVGVVLISAATLRGSDYNFRSLWNWVEPVGKSQLASQDSIDDESDLSEMRPSELDWETLLVAQGSETRLGEAIASILAREQNNPLAGIVVLTDGQNNSGLSPESAAVQAAAAQVPLYMIGLGSALDPTNVRLVNIDAPRRVFPGDRFRISATVQSTGFSGKSIPVQLRRRMASNSETAQDDKSFTVEQEKTIELAANGQLNAVDFEVLPPSIGRYSYEIQLLPPPLDANDKDNVSQTDVEVIEPKATVLILAGGPTREYQFVRNLLFRDATIQSHLLLQTGGPGMSQEADLLLTEFPSTAEDMAKYDCVLCFDADFMALEQASIDVLEEWVSSGAGGLVLIAGPVATPEWTGSAGNTDSRALKLRDMSPVILNSRGSRLISLGRFEGETVWPLVLSNESSSADFIDIANSKQLSAQAWKSFNGVYSFYATYQTKPGATPLAYFSDPTTTLDGAMPIYLASQFYGGGRVVFQGSGEIWRIREVDENYFNTYWTKLVRWSAQGRLLRDSDYGLLLTDKEEASLGEQVTIRAVLRDTQFKPLRQPSVVVNMIDPAGQLSPLTLTQFSGTGQEGVFVGQFLLRQAGKYQIRLDTKIANDAILTRQVIARVPALEIERPKRNDELLFAMSEQSGGAYFAGVQNAITGRSLRMDTPSAVEGQSSGSPPVSAIDEPLVKRITSRDQVNYLPGAPDREFQERWMTVLMLSIAAALSLEWLLRRLSRLA